jgi:ligand-binding sensor domain-containing protein/anti-sigma regulatory factor (Ser/Thr protein kinase)
MIHRFFSLLLLLCPILQGRLTAQSWAYRQYTAEQGLPSTEVYDIIQDKKGYIWVATDRGVARFDGYAFESLTTAEGLSNNVVFKLCEGPDGKIWFGEMPGTLSYYEKGRIHPAPQNPELKRYLGHTGFPVSMFTGKDYVDVGYASHGLLRLQHGKIKSLYSSDSSGKVVKMVDGHLLFGCTRGVALPVKEEGKTLIDYRGKHIYYQKEWNFNSRRVTALKRHNGDLIVTNSGVIRILKNDGTWQTYNTDNVLLFFETPDSSLYMVSKMGFCRYGPNEPFVPDNRFCHLKGSQINKIIMDREGGIWIATLNKGVFYCAHPGFVTYDFKDNVTKEGNLVYSLCSDYKGRVFTCIQNGSIYCFEKNREPLRIFPPRKNNAYGHIYYDTVNDYLLTCRQDRIDKAYEKTIRYKPVNTGNGTVAYRNGYLTGNYSYLGLQYCNPGQWKWEDLPLGKEEPQIQCMFRLKEDSIFLGTLSGLTLFRHGVLIPMLCGTAYAQERINDIEYIHPDKLALATIGKGLLLYHISTGMLEKITRKEGLASDVINDVALAPDGALWLAGNKGLTRLDRDAGGHYHVRNYTSYSGLPVSDLKNVFADSQTVYLGTHNGLILFDPHIPIVDHDPEIMLRAAYVNDKKVPVEALAHLGFRENNLRISYLSIIPKMMGQVMYRYQLQGPKNDHYWVYVREPQLFLSSVEPGNYRLIIQACNNAGQWSRVPLMLSISIAAPFWQTWWFIALCITGVVGVVILFQTRKLVQLREKAAGEKLMLDYQQQALINQINPHFLFNSMNSIQKYILREDKERAVSFVSKFAKLMRLGLEQSREAFIPLSKEIEMLNVYMLLENERFGKKFNYRLELQDGLEQQGLKIPPMLIQPFLENAIRHGILNKGGEGEVILRLYLDQQQLFCEVEDDGVGRKRALELKQEEGQIHKSFAMNINTSRLQLLMKSLNETYFFEITDKEDSAGRPAGTLVTFILPFKHEYPLHPDRR